MLLRLGFPVRLGVGIKNYDYYSTTLRPETNMYNCTYHDSDQYLSHRRDQTRSSCVSVE